MTNNTLTAIAGVRVGHASADTNRGCTVISFDRPLNVACATFGGACTTYNISNLELDQNYYQRHAIFVSDGGCLGLETAVPVSQGLAKTGIGWPKGDYRLPGICGAAIMSLWQETKFDPYCGQEAVCNLSSSPVKNGNIGAGLGATVGKFSWTENNLCLAMKAGIGSSAISLGDQTIIAALTVVNSLGNITSPDGTILCGNRHDTSEFRFRTFDGMSKYLLSLPTNTVITIIGTNIKLDFVQPDLTRLAQIAAHGHVRAINPVNTSLDGDTIFTFTTQEYDLPLTPLGQKVADPNSEWWKFKVDLLGQMAAKVVQESIYNACHSAETVKWNHAYQGIIPSIKDYGLLSKT